MVTSINDRHEASFRAVDLDDWTRMEARLVVYKTARHLGEAAKHVDGFRRRCDDPTAHGSIDDVAEKLDELRNTLTTFQRSL